MESWVTAGKPAFRRVLHEEGARGGLKHYFAMGACFRTHIKYTESSSSFEEEARGLFFCLF